MVAFNKKIINTVTPGQKKVLEYIYKIIQNNGYSPSLQEISNEFEFSLSTAQHYMEELVKKGYIRKIKNKSRALIPTDDISCMVMKMGYISAGKPIEPIENPLPILVPKSMIASSGQYYALEVKGDSMTDDGIWDKDIVVVKHQFTANANEIVVAITEDGVTLKQLKFKNGRPYLQPKNPKYPPIFPKERLEIRGKFVGLIRNS